MRPVFERVFREAGLPLAILTDIGPRPSPRRQRRIPQEVAGDGRPRDLLPSQPFRVAQAHAPGPAR
jgi:hypothetical protein